MAEVIVAQGGSEGGAVRALYFAVLTVAPTRPALDGNADGIRVTWDVRERERAWDMAPSARTDLQGSSVRAFSSVGCSQSAASPRSRPGIIAVPGGLT
jgi:hypothetical protein